MRTSKDDLMDHDSMLLSLRFETIDIVENSNFRNDSLANESSTRKTQNNKV